MRILIFGDSIGQGFFDTEHGGWAQRLAIDAFKEGLEDLRGDWPTVFNLSISGDTTEGVLGRMDAEISARRGNDEEIVVVIAIGTNDTVVYDDLSRTSLETFRLQLEALYQRCYKYSRKVMFVGLPAVDEKLSDPWKFSDDGARFTNARIKGFEDVIHDLAEARGIPFVPIFTTFKHHLDKGDDLLSDGLHPNAAGQKLMYEHIRPVLHKLTKA
jgi:acyl-CoA thioesterase-1